MLDQPQITQTTAQLAAVIRLTIPRSEIQNAMGSGIGELMTTLAAQGIAPTGPWYSHHLRMDPGIFDFEIGVPVSAPVTPAGRVVPGELPAATSPVRSTMAPTRVSAPLGRSFVRGSRRKDARLPRISGNAMSAGRIPDRTPPRGAPSSTSRWSCRTHERGPALTQGSRPPRRGPAIRGPRRAARSPAARRP